MKNEVKYPCPYCNTEHNTPSELAHCILACEVKKKKEIEDKRQAELKAQKESRKKEIENKKKELQFLLQEYIKDYGNYYETRSIEDNSALSQLWHMFF